MLINDVGSDVKIRLKTTETAVAFYVLAEVLLVEYVTSGQVQCAPILILENPVRFVTSGLHARHWQKCHLGLGSLALVKAAEDWGGWVAFVVLFFDGFMFQWVLFLEMAAT